MPQAARQGQDSAESQIVSGAQTVIVNGTGAVKIGDSTAKGHVIVTGSTTVFVEGKPMSKMGDTTNKGAAIRSGSPNVDVG